MHGAGIRNQRHEERARDERGNVKLGCALPADPAARSKPRTAYQPPPGSAPATPSVSTRFVAALQGGQPGVAVVELGSSDALLGAVGRGELDRDALREIGRKYEVDALIVGALRMQESQPRLDVDLDHGFELGSVRAQVRLDGNLEAKLVDTDRGATVWTGTSARWIELACVSGSSAGFGSVSVADRERQVERLLCDMVDEAAADFRPRYERRRVD